MATAGPMATPTDAALLTLAQWFSPGFPVGAFSYSHGQDWLVSTGALHSAAGVQTWIARVLTEGSGRNDLILLAQAWKGGDLSELDGLARALVPAAERLTETGEQGEAFVRTVNAVWGLDLPPLAYPVAVGAAARALDLPLEPTARMYLHAFAAALTSAAVRAIPLGQTEGQAIVHALSPLVDRLCRDDLHAPLDALGGAVFAADIAAMNHETQYSRMFRS
ncbi:MAG: urease accessory protein UreF [Pseudooceanicola sp.]|nr:urease accessory protein UreF [Pseudooceanicola sp.]